MSCDGVQALNPICQTGALVQDQAANTVNGAFGQMAVQFGSAASSATTWLWDQIDEATSLDLTSPQLLREMSATAALAGILCLGLFVLQVVISAIRREPAGLGRALKGLVISGLGSAAALATARILLGVTDALSDGIVSATMGTNMRGVGQKLAVGNLASLNNPAVTVLFAILVLCAVVVVWAAMMVRKMTLLIAAVLAPLAFAGATADITRAWVRKWIEFVAAMIASKLLLVVIFSMGATVVNGAGAKGTGPTQVATQLATGSLILLLAGLAPWVAIRMFHFVGDTLQAAHATAAQASTGARSLASMPQKASQLHRQTRAATGAARATAPSAHSTARVPAHLFASPPPPIAGSGFGGSANHAPAVGQGSTGFAPSLSSGPVAGGNSTPPPSQEEQQPNAAPAAAQARAPRATEGTPRE